MKSVDDIINPFTAEWLRQAMELRHGGAEMITIPRPDVFQEVHFHLLGAVGNSIRFLRTHQ